MTDRRPVHFRHERDVPHFAIYDAATGLYLAALLTPERRDEYCVLARLDPIPEPAREPA